MATFYLSRYNSDIVLGNMFSRKLAAGASTDYPYERGVIPNASTTGYAFTPAGVPGNAAWEAGPITVNLKITIGNANIYLAVQANRIDSAGTVLQSSSVTAEQNLSVAGTYTFTIPSVTWSAGSSTDRLRIDYIFRNADRKSTQYLTPVFDSVDDAVITPFTMSTNVAMTSASCNAKIPWQPIIAGAGVASTISDSSPGSWVSPIDSTHFLLTYEKNNANGLFARIGYVDGLNITYGSEFSHNTNVRAWQSSNTKIDTNKYLVVHGATTGGTVITGGYAFIATVSGDNISFGSVFAWDTTSDIRVCRAVAFSATKIVIGYMDMTALQYKLMVITVSGDSISFGTPASYSAINASRYGYFSMDKYSDIYGDHLYIVYDESTYGEYRVRAVDVSSDSFTFYTERQYTNGWIQGSNSNSGFRRENHCVFNRCPDAMGDYGLEYQADFIMAYGGRFRNYGNAYGAVASTNGTTSFTWGYWMFPYHETMPDNSIHCESPSSMMYVKMSEDIYYDWKAFKASPPYMYDDETRTLYKSTYLLIYGANWEFSTSPFQIKAQLFEHIYSVTQWFFYPDTHQYNYDVGARKPQDAFVVQASGTAGYPEVCACRLDDETAVVTYLTQDNYVSCQIIKLHYAGIAATISDPSGGWGGSPIFYVKSGGSWHAGTAKVKSSGSWVNPVSVFAKRP